MLRQFSRNASAREAANRMNQSGPIVLTRPRAQAEPLAQRLEQLGYAVQCFPLLDIAPLPERSAMQARFQATLAELKSYALAAFVSPNAIAAVFEQGCSWPSDVAIAVMGEGSRSALAAYGINDSNTRIFRPTDRFRTDSETLLESLDLPALRNRKVVLFRAETGRELLSDALAAHGIVVDKVVAYRRFAPILTAQRAGQLQHLLGCSACWVVSSSEALKTLEQMVLQSGDPTAVVKMHQLKLWVSHQRIAQNAEKSGFMHVDLIGSGDENLLHALQSRL